MAFLNGAELYGFDNRKDLAVSLCQFSNVVGRLLEPPGLSADFQAQMVAKACEQLKGRARGGETAEVALNREVRVGNGGNGLLTVPGPG